MSRDEALAAQQRLTDVAAGEGLAFRFDLARGGNTFDGTACCTSPPSTACRTR